MTGAKSDRREDIVKSPSNFYNDGCKYSGTHHVRLIMEHPGKNRCP